jgi:undecaprenyl-diphosphatase
VAGGAFVAFVGGLLVLTGLLQGATEALDLVGRETPTVGGTLFVGALRGSPSCRASPGSGRPSPCYCSAATKDRSHCGSPFSPIPANGGAALLVVVTAAGCRVSRRPSTRWLLGPTLLSATSSSTP